MVAIAIHLAVTASWTFGVLGLGEASNAPLTLALAPAFGRAIGWGLPRWTGPNYLRSGRNRSSTL
jgi:hypothetical protein